MIMIMENIVPLQTPFTLDVIWCPIILSSNFPTIFPSFSSGISKAASLVQWIGFHGFFLSCFPQASPMIFNYFKFYVQI